ncbi:MULTISPECIES: hypothetical protein [Cyanophyceae]|uniref:hypothetical protein n=1 Tax=Cyanophyceae TaxID=3028117 RepID=UPI00168270A0|nr:MULTISPECIES: hypothetical protein [Cyanophyceae]MBD1916554.1 hypothetical protein [Phormidium sp. FACHB-77]MBD2032121.1 hypothetical protein [Phormidium sp. FACHB-322]MBD2053001.1 hypothetical protein [Leptolyngbya sp. FACHB-60]
MRSQYAACGNEATPKPVLGVSRSGNQPRFVFLKARLQTSALAPSSSYGREDNRQTGVANAQV